MPGYAKYIERSAADTRRNGLFFKESIKKGEIVLIACTDQYLFKDPIAKRRMDNNEFPIVLAGGDVACFLKGESALINHHGTDPSCTMQINRDGPEVRIVVTTLRDVKAGDECTYSYVASSNGKCTNIKFFKCTNTCCKQSTVPMIIEQPVTDVN